MPLTIHVVPESEVVSPKAPLTILVAPESVAMSPKAPLTVHVVPESEAVRPGAGVNWRFQVSLIPRVSRPEGQ